MAAGNRAGAGPPASVSLRLLSGFELVVDDTPVAVPASAQRVVAYLALQSRPQPRASVASSLWIDLTETRASANLRGALWRLDTVRDRVIDARANRLCLTAEVAVDVAAAIAGARRLLDADQPRGPDPSPHRSCHVDLELLAGDLLPDWDDDWILFERERLRQLRIHAIEALSENLRLAGRHAEAVEAGLAAVDADPLRESAQRVLIEAHLAEGNLADARRQFAAFRCLLDAELGVDPSPRLRRLVGLTSAD